MTSSSDRSLSRRGLIGLGAAIAGAGLVGGAVWWREASDFSSPPTASANGRTDYFPSSERSWVTVDPAQTGWRPDALEAALQFAADKGSATVMIVQGGRIVAERYWLGAGPHTTLDVASIQKSVTSVLIGIAQQAGHLSLDDPVTRWLGAGWSRESAEEESQITVRHLLSMSSGLDSNLGYSAPPGTRWYYNTLAYSKLQLVLAQATGASLSDYSSKELFDRVGMSGAMWASRPSGKTSTATESRVGLRLRARDMARFGLLVLAQGTWAGTQIVSADYLRSALAPSQQDNPSYGWLWWLNGGRVHRLPGSTDPKLVQGPVIPDAPHDLVAALGAMDQKLYVVPSLDLVVTRQGRPTGPPSEGVSTFDSMWWQRLMAAAPPR